MRYVRKSHVACLMFVFLKGVWRCLYKTWIYRHATFHFAAARCCLSHKRRMG